MLKKAIGCSKPSSLFCKRTTTIVWKDAKEKIFIRALEYGVFLNPKKCAFVVTKGKLLGNIVSKDGVRIDPKRVSAIDKVPEPKNVKGIQFFLGHVNFLRRFVTNFAKIRRLISKMLKKGEEVKWDNEPSKTF